jgi:hypothetical protein
MQHYSQNPALCCKQEGQGLSSRWDHWVFVMLRDPSSRTRPWGLLRNERQESSWGVKRKPPSVSRFYIKCGSLNISKTYGPPQPVTGIALLFTLKFIHLKGDNLKEGYECKMGPIVWAAYFPLRGPLCTSMNIFGPFSMSVFVGLQFMSCVLADHCFERSCLRIPNDVAQKASGVCVCGCVCVKKVI